MRRRFDVWLGTDSFVGNLGSVLIGLSIVSLPADAALPLRVAPGCPPAPPAAPRLASGWRCLLRYPPACWCAALAAGLRADPVSLLPPRCPTRLAQMLLFRIFKLPLAEFW